MNNIRENIQNIREKMAAAARGRRTGPLGDPPLRRFQNE